MVTDVIVSPGKGLVLLPGLSAKPRGLRKGSLLELVRADGTRLVTKVAALVTVGGSTRVCVPFAAPVGPGTEVWLDPSKRGVTFRAPATGAGALNGAPARR